MSFTMSKTAFEGLIKGDLEWLLKQPRDLERDHIEALLKQAPELIYDRFDLDETRLFNEREKAFRDGYNTAVRYACESFCKAMCPKGCALKQPFRCEKYMRFVKELKEDEK